MAQDHGDPKRRRKLGKSGFRPAAAAAGEALKAAGARRGIAEHRLIARWAEVAGPELAAYTAPIKIAHARGVGGGGTLVVAAEGARAVEAAHLGHVLVERVNAVFGYGAVSRVKIVQAGAGASQGAASRRDRRGGPAPVDAPVSPDISAIGDEGLRDALARLEANLKRRAASAADARSTS